MKRRVNKKKVTLAIIILILAILMITALPVFARYIYNNVRDAYLKSRNFNFSSNLLTTSDKTYSYSNWSGIEDYEINFKLYSYENELSLFKYDGQGLGYTLSCTVEDASKATAHIDFLEGESTNESFIPNNTNIREVKIYLRPTDELNPGDKVTLSVTAKTTVPYKKTISAKFRIQISEKLISAKIEDKPSRIYATLRLINAENKDKNITLTFDPNKVMIDTSDESYINRVDQKTTKISGVDYVNSVTIKLGAEQSKDIKFYKRDISADYTYPGGSTQNMIIDVKE